MDSEGTIPADHLPNHAPTVKRGVKASSGKKGVFFHNRIAPGKQHLYIAKSDGTEKHPLLGKHSSNTVFTNKRNGDGNAGSRTDGTDLEELIATSSMEDSGVMSSDSSKLAYVSLSTKEAHNLTDMASTRPDPNRPSDHFYNVDEIKNGYCSFSPDGSKLVYRTMGPV
ncbi:hypothetical protein N7532_009256 [Penicillium argentinense]|uniref:Dipeptidylpeptidase IV N-terminal domain-containing protein n=1 Tax=Penicillium argentinense TaxID=1131581 RepID=A0A9W9K3A6_9EURO|nr:uncharacterized protein N7532_009256 [Penicillium argentinense]KAJ5090572.1 hypothetical protein N7532_009256 [Penicillium argentinense]